LNRIGVKSILFCETEKALASRKSQEWFDQADYDMETAEYMFGGGRNFYAVFMCHLSLEKALKALYTQNLNEEPPRTHNLIFLVEKIGLKPPANLFDAIFSLNRASVPTRYPDDLKRMLKDYGHEKTEEILDKSKEILKWLSEQR